MSWEEILSRTPQNTQEGSTMQSEAIFHIQRAGKDLFLFSFEFGQWIWEECIIISISLMKWNVIIHLDEVLSSSAFCCLHGKHVKILSLETCLSRRPAMTHNWTKWITMVNHSGWTNDRKGLLFFQEHITTKFLGFKIRVPTHQLTANY